MGIGNNTSKIISSLGTTARCSGNNLWLIISYKNAAFCGAW
jgi:hypothetical protein